MNNEKMALKMEIEQLEFIKKTKQKIGICLLFPIIGFYTDSYVWKAVLAGMFLCSLLFFCSAYYDKYQIMRKSQVLDCIIQEEKQQKKDKNRIKEEVEKMGLQVGDKVYLLPEACFQKEHEKKEFTIVDMVEMNGELWYEVSANDVGRAFVIWYMCEKE